MYAVAPRIRELLAAYPGMPATVIAELGPVHPGAERPGGGAAMKR